MVHTYKLNDCFIAIDGNSGSIHLLDEITYDILKDSEELPELSEIIQRLNKKYPMNEIEDAYNEIIELKNDDVLFTENQDLEKLAHSKNIDTSVKAMCLHVSHDCNLRCEYCFASEGDYNCGRKLMSIETAKKAVDYLIKNSKGRSHIEIDFFGGEPMMNFDVVKETVAYGRSLEKSIGKHFWFTTTTNGTLMNKEQIDFINENMDNVVISVDGRKEIHDKIRHDCAGNGSYDRIIPNAKELVEGRNGKSYFIRGTFTAKNKDFSNDVMHLADLGFKEISVEPVVGSGSDLYFTQADVPELLAEYENLALKYLDRLSKGDGFRFYHFNINLYDGPCLFKRITACGAGYEYVAVDPDGKIFPCHQFVGHDEFSIGDINIGITKPELSKEFQQNTIFKKPKCRDCWAKLFCSGGCHANAFFTNGSIYEPNELSCTLQKKRIECAVMIQIKIESEKAEKEEENHVLL